jgi:hypothetical protein
LARPRPCHRPSQRVAISSTPELGAPSSSIQESRADINGGSGGGGQEERSRRTGTRAEQVMCSPDRPVGRRPVQRNELAGERTDTAGPPVPSTHSCRCA